MTRFEDWQPRLGDYLHVAGRRDFQWGEFDCALFAIGAIAVMTGEFILPDLPGSYDSEEGAADWLTTNGYADLAAAVDHYLGDRQSPKLAMRGDLIMVAGACGIVDLSGERIAFLSPTSGLVFAKRSLGTASWRIG